MKQFISKNILTSIILMFLVAISLQIFLNIQENREIRKNIIKEYGNLLATYTLKYKQYYQDLFSDGTLHFDSATVKVFPTHSMPIISKSFSDVFKGKIDVDIASDNPRNEKNRANKYELDAINYFKFHKEKKSLFKEYDEFYQYSAPLKITQKCLKCHGKSEKAPEFIRKSYKNAYNMKIGDIRGVVNIKIYKKIVDKYLDKLLWINIVKNIILFTILLVFIIYISRKNSKFSKMLEKMVQEKSKKIVENEKRIIFLNKFDSLTKLPNRITLKEDLKRENITKLACLNIDDFKYINELYGINIGDLVLKEYAKELQNLSIESDLSVYRLSSDEFALYPKKDIENLKFIETIKKIIDKLNSIKFIQNKYDISISTTAGIAFEGKNILRKADIALKLAKKENVEIKIYDRGDNIELNIQKNIEILNKIKSAIKNDNITPYFQPIKSIKDNKIEKYEALARIVDKDKVIPPGLFLDIAQKSRLYNHITESMIRKTFAVQKEYPHLSFSINFSYEDIKNDKTVAFFKESLKELDNPSKIIVEILENEKIEDYDKISNFIQEIKKIGAKFAIDDFGAGYSNFLHLIELDIDFIKIDASLIKNIASNQTSYAVVRSIVAFAKTIEAKTVAEYVENQEIYDTIREIGVDYAQGYFIGKPNRDIIL